MEHFRELARRVKREIPSLALPLRRQVSLLLLLVLVPLISAGCATLPAKVTQVECDPSCIYEKNKGDMVRIVKTRYGQQWSGSGFLIGSDTIVTNHHVVNGAQDLKVFREGAGLLDGFAEEDPRTLAFSDSNNDVVLLKLRSPVRPSSIILGHPSEIIEGEKCVALGYPLVPSLAVSDGIFNRKFLNEEPNLIQHGCHIAPGSSGGPLFTTKGSRGRVVGINTLVMRYNDYFSVGINHVSGRVKDPGGHSLKEISSPRGFEEPIPIRQRGCIKENEIGYHIGSKPAGEEALFGVTSQASGRDFDIYLLRDAKPPGSLEEIKDRLIIFSDSSGEDALLLFSEREMPLTIVVGEKNNRGGCYVVDAGPPAW